MPPDRWPLVGPGRASNDPAFGSTATASQPLPSTCGPAGAPIGTASTGIDTRRPLAPPTLTPRGTTMDLVTPPGMTPALPCQPTGPGRNPGRTLGSLAVFTFAPCGGVNAKLDMAGRPRVRDVKPIWKAGPDMPRANICTCSGRWVTASIEITTRSISDWSLRGAIVS